ncbi:MAG: ABC transporter ATP-binding protein [Deltaproteobacteria bacterium]|nr:ABC transporter ATP-binding protein [Deltaproteobacteria bacterium]
MEPASVLSIRGLTTVFKTDLGVARAVDKLDLEIPARATLGIVGESGCGKSTVGLSIMKLIPSPPGRITEGELRFEGQDLLRLSNRAMRRIRGRRISMIFQEPMTSLNPVRRVGETIIEVISLHYGLSRKEARKRALEALENIRLPEPEIRINDYPHEMSGGMRQRIMIALAICCQPELIIADEPTTALDVTIQAQILSLLGRIQKETGTSIVLITHDLGVIAENADQVAVMYAGQLVEYADTPSLFQKPLHPYTQGLMLSVPRPGGGGKKKHRLTVIPGSVPNLLKVPPGCRFASRCSVAFQRCYEEEPALIEQPGGRTVRCWRYA